MVVLEKYKLFLRLIGMSPFGGVEPIIVSLIHSVICVIQLVLSLIFIVQNIHENALRALRTLPLIFGLESTLAVYWYLLIRRKHVHSLFDELRSVVEQSMLSCSF